MYWFSSLDRRWLKIENKSELREGRRGVRRETLGEGVRRHEGQIIGKRQRDVVNAWKKNWREINKTKRKIRQERIGEMEGSEWRQWIPNGEWWSLLIRSAAQAVSFGHSIIQSFGWCCFPLRGSAYPLRPPTPSRRVALKTIKVMAPWESGRVVGAAGWKNWSFRGFRCVFIH